MLNVSTTLPTPAPPSTPAPAKLAGGDFQDLLGGLGIAPVADPLLAVPAVKVAPPGLCAIAPTMVAVPVTGEIAAPTITTVADADAMMPVGDVAFAPPPTIPLEKMPEPASLLPTLPDKRQALADGGKPLPDEVADDDPNEDVIWLTASLQPVPAPAARPLMSPKAIASTVSVAPPAPVSAAVMPAATVSAETDQAGAANAPATTPAQTGVRSGEAIAPSPPSPAWTPAAASVAVSGNTPIPPAKTDAPAVVLPVAIKPDLPVRTDTPVPAAAQPAPIQQAPLQPAPAILPAGQAFAAAIAAAVQQGRDEREAGEPHAPLALATATLERLHAPAVAATPDARQAALDLRQDSGLQGMIDHIEVLRDGANAGDTRIRLIPDALGAVDVSVRREGERLHVHFNAETQASARLIADAQSRLAELADARGVKLGQTSVDSGDGQQHRQQPATPIQFTRPAPAVDSTETPDDLRVA